MRKVMFILLGILLVSGLMLVSCQKKETPQTKEGAAKTGGYGEKAAGYGEKAAGYGEKGKEVIQGYPK